MSAFGQGLQIKTVEEKLVSLFQTLHLCIQANYFLLIRKRCARANITCLGKLSRRKNNLFIVHTSKQKLPKELVNESFGRACVQRNHICGAVLTSFCEMQSQFTIFTP